MDAPGEFYLYATTYRLALLAVGAMAILLGYRLFLRGVSATGGSGTDASAEGGGFKVSVGNAAPGTCFTLFGAVLIVAMAIDGNPEYLRTQGQNGEEIRVKGIGGGALAATPDFAGKDLDAYRQTLSTPDIPPAAIADAIAGVAYLYLGAARPGEALTLARLAVQIDGADPQKLDLLAAAALANASAEEAAAAQAQASVLRNGDR